MSRVYKRGTRLIATCGVCYERVALFWLPYFRSLGVNVPVVLCANKSDLTPEGNGSQVVEDEMLPVMAEFKEIDSCIRTSSREHRNVNEAFFLCQKAVTHPIAPLFDSKESALKPAADDMKQYGSYYGHSSTRITCLYKKIFSTLGSKCPPLPRRNCLPLAIVFLSICSFSQNKDNDGGLNDTELASLFAPTPGLPPSWIEGAFPCSTVRNETGHITLQGWLAQWSVTTFTSPKTTLEYLAYLGFESSDRGNPTTTAALKVTKPRKKRQRPGRVGRNVVMCYVLGAPASGKSSLLDAFLSRGFSSTYHPTIQSRTAVNTVELPGGKQCYLILDELGELEPALLENKTKLLDQCDVVAYTYDSSDPDSFAYIPMLRDKYPHLAELPSVFVALKADLDRTTQRAEFQPDEYTSRLNMPSPPLHVSVTWDSIQELFVHLAGAAMEPSTAFPRTEDDVEGKWMAWGIAIGAVVCAGAAAVVIWRRATGGMN
ncbi:mitochondrial GTPase [Histoplasma capsulatum H143]|uniref:Mitochondrial GTPase n=1 Tax=Ajellomyces capsulatus (strain H143) TaxID=544712 RepID=C6HCT9_AJECH|nr:mitochondrial GTPase [Histoplasma capsulatum H143]